MDCRILPQKLWHFHSRGHGLFVFSLPMVLFAMLHFNLQCQLVVCHTRQVFNFPQLTLENCSHQVISDLKLFTAHSNTSTSKT